MRGRVGIIGAGPAGLAAAYALGKLGVPADVFESGSTVGGMAKTFELWGQKVDLGPHRFFSSNVRVNRLWLDIAGTDYRMVERRTRIFCNRRFFKYPLRLGDSLSKLGPAEAARCLLSYLREKFRRERPAANFEDWVRGRFGRRLYDNFFRGYSEKLWGIPCHHLDADFAAQRIRKLSLYEVVRSTLGNGRGNGHATLVDRFAYPLAGTGSIYSRMADAINIQGGSVHLNTPVLRVAPRADGMLDIELLSGKRHAYPHIVSTMPLTHLVGALPGVPRAVMDACSRLHYRNTIVVYLRIEARSLFPDQWVYIHDPKLAVGRITNFRNWIPELYGDNPGTILALELWLDQESASWSQPDAFHIERACQDLHRTGLLHGAQITASHAVRVPFCYPVYRLGYKNHVQIIRNYLKTIPGLDAIGRCGSFKYNNQDHSILMGILVAEKIALVQDHDLWNVNCGDVYQEAAIINETGLVPQSS
jgi:protoporphyrinogen oxidase